MSEQPAEYGKELIEAVAEGICRVMFADESVHGEARCCKLGGASGCCVKDLYPEARAALLAACAKLREPSEAMELAADMAVGRRVDWPEYDDVWRATIAQLVIELGIDHGKK